MFSLFFINSWTIPQITCFCKAVLLQLFNGFKTCSLVMFFECFLMFRIWVLQNRNTQAFLWINIFYFCFWQFACLLSFHPNFFGPPSVIQMLQLQLEGLCRMPDRKYTLYYTPRGGVACFLDKRKKRKLLFERLPLITSSMCVWGSPPPPPNRNEDTVKANNNLFTNSGGSWKSKKLFLHLLCPDVKQCMITLWAGDWLVCAAC